MQRKKKGIFFPFFYLYLIIFLLIESSGEHLQTKRQLETVKAHFKEDWLRAQAGSAVQELMGLQPSSAITVGSVASITSSTRPLFNSTPLGSPKPSILPLAPYPGHLDELVRKF